MSETGGYLEEPKEPNEPGREGEQPLYHHEAKFPGTKGVDLSGQAYSEAQGIIFKDRESDLSAYRLMLNAIYFVAVLGVVPGQDTDEQIQQALSRGEPASLPSEILAALNQRRLEMKQHGEWVEGHYRPAKHI